MKSDLLFEAISKTDEKYVAESENMFKTEKRRDVFKNVLKYTATAASVVLICAFAVFMWIIAENNRDPVASTDTTHGTAAVTSPDTDIPATDTETVTDPATDVTTETPDEDFETKVRAMLADYYSEQARSFLFDPDNVSPVFDIAAQITADTSAEKELQNNAAHFIYAVLSEDHAGDLLYYGITPVEFGFPKAEAEGYTYLLWLESYLEEAKKAAEGLSADCVQTRAYRTYSLLCASGYEFYTPGDTESRIVDKYERALTLYNAVWGGKPIIDGSTVKISKPYPAELEAAIKEYWGDTDRAFYTSETLTEKSVKALSNGVFVSDVTAMLIKSTKYFIIADGKVYMTPADENDGEAEAFYLSSYKNYYEFTSGSVSLDAFRSDKDGNEYRDHLFFNKTESSSLKIAGSEFTYDLIIKRGDEAIEYLVNALSSRKFSSSNPVDSAVIYNMKEETLSYIASHYFTEKSEKLRAALSSVFADYLDREAIEFFMYSNTEKPDCMADYSFVSGAFNPGPGWLQNYYDAAKEAANNLYEEEMIRYYPVTYSLLKNTGFKDYRSGDYDLVYRSRALILKLGLLYDSVVYGSDLTDETSVKYVYSDEEEGGTGEWPEKITSLMYNKYGVSPGYYGYNAFTTLKQGLKTVNEWYKYFSDVLPEKDVRAFIGDGNAVFMIDNDGTIYTQYTKGMLMWTMEIYERTARVIEEKDGYTVIGFLVDCPGNMADEVREFTVNVKSGKNGLYIDGGSFIDVFMKKSITRYDAASALSDILRAHALIYNGQTDASVYRSANSLDLSEAHPILYGSKADLPADFTSRYNGYEPDVFPTYFCFAFFQSVHFEDFVSGQIYDEIMKDGGCFKHVKDQFCFVTPSLVTVTNTAKACENGDYSIYNIEKALKNVSVKGDKMTVSLDFVRTENGKSTNKTYTFEFEYKDGKAVLTGGTFVTECIYGGK